MVEVDNIVEFICDKCKGTGYEPGQNLNSGILEICGKCLGHGKLDWIERVVGKKRPKMYIDDTPSHTHNMPSAGEIIPFNNSSHTHSSSWNQEKL